MQKWERLNELVQEQEKLKKEYRKESMLPIGGAATKMGSNLFSSGKEKKDMEKAYDKLQNMREQEIENNAVKIKQLKKEVYKDTKDYGPSDEDKKLARDDEFRQMTLKDIGMNKGGAVKAKSKAKPSIAIVIGTASKKMAKGGKVAAPIKEYGGKEKYASEAAMMKHEKKEPMKVEKKEKKMAFGGDTGQPMNARQNQKQQAAMLDNFNKANAQQAKQAPAGTGGGARMLSGEEAKRMGLGMAKGGSVKKKPMKGIINKFV
jgi:hypothetical protein